MIVLSVIKFVLLMINYIVLSLNLCVLCWYVVFFVIFNWIEFFIVFVVIGEFDGVLFVFLGVVLVCVDFRWGGVGLKWCGEEL